MTYQQSALHERGSNVRQQTKMALAGRQRVNEQTKKFMKNEYVTIIHVQWNLIMGQLILPIIVRSNYIGWYIGKCPLC